MRRPWLLLLATILVVALAVLATLQYRWISDLSAADEERERAALDFAARRFGDDVDAEAGRTLAMFQQTGRDTRALVRRYEEWMETAHDTRFIGAFYVADLKPAGPELFRFDPQRSTLTPAEWTPALAAVRPLLRTREDGPPLQRPPVVPELPAIVAALRPDPPRLVAEDPPPRDQPPPDDFDRPPGPPGPFGRPRPLRQLVMQRPTPAFLIIQIDRNYLGEWFRDLVQRHFPGGKYDVAVVAGNDVVFRSDGQWPQTVNAAAEATAPMFMLRPARDRSDAPFWRVLVRRHGSPLAEVVAATRRRNLAISTAILVLLLGSFVLLAVLTRRTERLRMQQLEFVAGITHELNTPLAALRSAGQNLADGIVTERAQVERYGTMIANDARRLSDTVAQVLDFAGMQSRGTPPRFAPVDVAAVVDEAVAQCRWLADEAKVEIETQVARDLPLVDGDPVLLTRAVQNLIANAIRHGGEGGWVGVRASAERGGIAVTVEDRGRGIAARDIPHLFDPFFRGRDAARTRGSGLGLTIVHQVAKAHNGTVDVARRRERGAAFTLHLPARPAAAASRQVQHA